MKQATDGRPKGVTKFPKPQPNTTIPPPDGAKQTRSQDARRPVSEGAPYTRTGDERYPPPLTKEDEQPASKSGDLAPHRKVLAAGTGAGIGGNISVILAYYFPDLPATVTAAYTSLILAVLALAAAYFTPPESS